MTDYIETRNGGLYVAGTRIFLDSIVYAFNRGSAPESILRSFPAIGALEAVYGAITYYLANKTVVDQYLADRHTEFESQRTNQTLPLGLKARLDAARPQLQTTRP